MLGLLVAWSVAAAAFDLRQRRIPNLLLLLVAVPAVGSLLVVGHGLLGAGIIDSLIGLGIGGLSHLPGYAFGKVGAGDVKLSGLQGFLLGGMGALQALVVGALCLGLMAICAILTTPDRGRSARLPAAIALVVGFLWVVTGNFLLPGWGL